MAHSLQSLYKACKTDFLCTLNLLRMVYLNLQNVDCLLKGFCILRSVTQNTWLQSFTGRYFHCAFLGFCLGIFDSNVQPTVWKFGCICLEWFARGQRIWEQIFEKWQIPTPCPASSRWLYIDIGPLKWQISARGFLIHRFLCLIKNKTYKIINGHIKVSK